MKRIVCGLMTVMLWLLAPVAMAGNDRPQTASATWSTLLAETGMGERGKAATDGPSQLMNYENWLLQYMDELPFRDANSLNSSASILDSFLQSLSGNGFVSEAVEYPREWPAQWLDGAIPAYTGTGWMFDLYVTHPAMSYASDDVAHVAVTVYDYLPEEVDAYITGLLSSGFEEITNDRYFAEWMENVRSFRGRECTLNIVFAHGGAPVISFTDPDDGYPFVQFNVDFDRDPYVPDTSPSAGTELMNIEQWTDLTGQFGGKPPEMNQVVFSETDAYGRLYETVYYPSQWPKDIFGNLIPEFVFPAVLHSMTVTTPADNPSPDQTLIVSLYLVAYYPEYIDAYAKELAAFGYRAVPPEEYTEAEAASAAQSGVYHIFSLPSMRLYLGTFNEDGLEKMQICLRFDGRYTNFFNQ